MKGSKPILSAFALGITLSLIACSSESKKSATPALFNSKVEAEAAAKDFNCSGAHKMGDKWMPCKSHKAHDEHKKHGSHVHHHNH